jgi:hypothetical protein
VRTRISAIICLDRNQQLSQRLHRDLSPGWITIVSKVYQYPFKG